MNFKQLTILNISGMFVAIGLGLFGKYGFRIDYPLAWLFWVPGWLMMTAAFILGKISEKKSE